MLNRTISVSDSVLTAEQLIRQAVEIYTGVSVHMKNLDVRLLAKLKHVRSCTEERTLGASGVLEYVAPDGCRLRREFNAVIFLKDNGHRGLQPKWRPESTFGFLMKDVGGEVPELYDVYYDMNEPMSPRDSVPKVTVYRRPKRGFVNQTTVGYSGHHLGDRKQVGSDTIQYWEL